PSGFLRTFYHFGYVLDSSASESTPYRSLPRRQSFQVVRIGIAQRISLISFGIGTAFSSTKYVAKLFFGFGVLCFFFSFCFLASLFFQSFLAFLFSFLPGLFLFFLFQRDSIGVLLS